MAQIDNSKRVAVVTGCSEINSLGAAFSRELLRRGWTVFSTARKLATLAPLQDLGCHAVELDVVSDASVAAAVKHITTLTGGRIDLLLNNAGATGAASLVRTDPTKLVAMHDLHVLGPLRLAQAMFPYLSRSTDKRRKNVNIGSVISHGMPWHAAYASTKAGAQVLSDVMRREFAPFGIDVITLELALVQTAMSTGAKDFPLEYPVSKGERYDATVAIEQAGKEFAENGRKAPHAAEVAKQVVDAVEMANSPGKLWLGRQSYVFRWVMPYLPVSMADKLTSKLLRVDLVKV